MERSLTETSDRYLDYHGHSQEAYEHVKRVLDCWEFSVDLARQRAEEKLELPLAKVIPFPRAYMESTPPLSSA